MRLKTLFFCRPTCPRNSKPTRPGSLAGLRVLEVLRFRRHTCPRHLAFPPTYLSSQSCVSADLLVLVILRFCQPTCPRKPGRLKPSQGLPMDNPYVALCYNPMTPLSQKRRARLRGKCRHRLEIRSSHAAHEKASGVWARARTPHCYNSGKMLVGLLRAFLVLVSSMLSLKLPVNTTIPR